MDTIISNNKFNNVIMSENYLNNSQQIENNIISFSSENIIIMTRW